MGSTSLFVRLLAYNTWKSVLNKSDKSDLKILVLFVVGKGANINAKNKDGETPSDVLRKRCIDLEVVV